MTYKLAEKNQLQDVSWIKPGQVSWEWWNDASPYGPDVDLFPVITWILISITLICF